MLPRSAPRYRGCSVAAPTDPWAGAATQSRTPPVPAPTVGAAPLPEPCMTHAHDDPAGCPDHDRHAALSALLRPRNGQRAPDRCLPQVHERIAVQEPMPKGSGRTFPPISDPSCQPLIDARSEVVDGSGGETGGARGPDDARELWREAAGGGAWAPGHALERACPEPIARRLDYRRHQRPRSSARLVTRAVGGEDVRKGQPVATVKIAVRSPEHSDTHPAWKRILSSLTCCD